MHQPKSGNQFIYCKPGAIVSTHFAGKKKLTLAAIHRQKEDALLCECERMQMEFQKERDEWKRERQLAKKQLEEAKKAPKKKTKSKSKKKKKISAKKQKKEKCR